MKLFGEFLVDKGLITEDQLLEVVMQQVASAPSLPELLRKLDLLPGRDLLKVFKRQAQRGLEFRTAAQSLGLWSEELEEKVRKSLSLERKPIGEILVSQGVLQQKELPYLLDEYFSLLRSGKHGDSLEEDPPKLSSLQREALQSFNFPVFKAKVEGLLVSLEGDASDSRAINELQEMLKTLQGMHCLLRFQSQQLIGEKLLIQLRNQNPSNKIPTANIQQIRSELDKIWKTFEELQYPMREAS